MSDGWIIFLVFALSFVVIRAAWALLGYLHDATTPQPTPPEPHKTRHEREMREWSREFNGLLREHGCDIQWVIRGGILSGRECTKHGTAFRYDALCPKDPSRYRRAGEPIDSP